ncbi:MAG TPA: HAMP domain-containing histidine kinase [Nitratifractor sp.]|nr:HAMP domain-containing histidine kinase [Nitratifractor sp.]HHH20802.1 HAMP domain-containing histidine kinase [Nitratifractor sp.]
MATLVFITSFSLYFYIRNNTNTQLVETMQKQADFLLTKYPNLQEGLKKQREILKNTLNIDTSITYAPFMKFQPKAFRIVKKRRHYYLQGYFAYNFRSQLYLLLKKDISKNIKFENLVYKAVIFSNIISLVVIIFYAFFLSKMLTKPINFFSQKIAKMNEEQLAVLELNSIPIEFKPLGNSINQLIKKIESFIYYKKELFIGAAHELKTPLAVMKTKAQVTLIKRDKSIETLTQSIEQNIQSINDLNAIVESILAFGRAEGAQFEQAQRVDIVDYIQKIVDEFNIVAHEASKQVIYKSFTKGLNVSIQPMLLRHILQNIIQNAVAFTPPKSSVRVSSFINRSCFIVRVQDCGPGFPKDLDIFAPFKRSKTSKGTGLGLFLAKNSVDSLGAKLLFKNKKVTSGAVVTLLLPLEL